MKITFIGTGAAINSSDNGASILINENILIDTPCGIPQTLHRFKCDISKLDTIIITHLHGDHVFGLPFLLLEYISRPRETPLTILAPSGTQKLIFTLLELAFPKSNVEQLLAPAKPLFQILDDEKEIMLKEIFIRSHKIPHGQIETYGIEFGETGTKKIFYAPDTSYSDKLTKIIETIDIAILDATTQNDTIKGHMSMRQVNDLAKKYLDKEFMLTHRSDYSFYPESYSLLNHVKVPTAGTIFYY
jgi:ribonuclease BN (tRNA processing enzyme)